MAVVYGSIVVVPAVEPVMCGSIVAVPAVEPAMHGSIVVVPAAEPVPMPVNRAGCIMAARQSGPARQMGPSCVPPSSVPVQHARQACMPVASRMPISP